MVESAGPQPEGPRRRERSTRSGRAPQSRTAPSHRREPPHGRVAAAAALGGASFAGHGEMHVADGSRRARWHHRYHRPCRLPGRRRSRCPPIMSSAEVSGRRAVLTRRAHRVDVVLHITGQPVSAAGKPARESTRHNDSDRRADPWTVAMSTGPAAGRLPPYTSAGCGPSAASISGRTVDDVEHRVGGGVAMSIVAVRATWRSTSGRSARRAGRCADVPTAARPGRVWWNANGRRGAPDRTPPRPRRHQPAGAEPP